eukprot:4163756-Alexandrium_andersonii.AAC.1
MTRDEAKFLPISIAQAQVAPATHEQKEFVGFDSDSRRQTHIAEAAEAKRSLAKALGQRPLKFIHLRDFGKHPQR